MTFSDALTIAIPAVALLAILTIPGQPRWTRRPWLIAGELRRIPVAIAIGVLLLIAIAHATT